MSLTNQDLSAITRLLDDHAEAKIRPLVQQVVNASVAHTNDTIKENNKIIGRAFDNLTLMIGEGFNEVSENFIEVRSDINVLQSDMIEVKAAISELKADVSLLKADVSELKLDMRDVKWGLADTVHRTEFLDVRDRVTRLEHRPRSK